VLWRTTSSVSRCLARAGVPDRACSMAAVRAAAAARPWAATSWRTVVRGGRARRRLHGAAHAAWHRPVRQLTVVRLGRPACARLPCRLPFSPRRPCRDRRQSDRHGRSDHAADAALCRSRRRRRATAAVAAVARLRRRSGRRHLRLADHGRGDRIPRRDWAQPRRRRRPPDGAALDRTTGPNAGSQSPAVEQSYASASLDSFGGSASSGGYCTDEGDIAGTAGSRTDPGASVAWKLSTLTGEHVLLHHVAPKLGAVAGGLGRVAGPFATGYWMYSLYCLMSPCTVVGPKSSGPGRVITDSAGACYASVCWNQHSSGASLLLWCAAWCEHWSRGGTARGCSRIRQGVPSVRPGLLDVVG
jgi:hypothetical protein